MSTVGDALTALKNVVLMQERLDVMRRDFGSLAGKVDKLSDRIVDIDRRVLRIETMVEMSRAAASAPPRIEG